MEESHPRRSVWARRILALCLLAIAAGAPYLGGLGHDFVYDDHGQLVENAFLHNPARARDVLLLRTLRDPNVVNGRRPVVLLTYFADRALWGVRPAGYHATNLGLHVLTVWLFYLLLLQLGRGGEAKGGEGVMAFLGALLLGLHPVLIEAVHVPSFRPDILYSLFLLAYLLAALQLRPRPGAARHVAAWTGLMLLLLFLALASKEAAVVAPVVLTGMWICFPGSRPGRRTAAIVLALSLAVIAGLGALCAGGGSFQAAGVAWNGLSLQFPANLYTMPWLWLRYLGLLLWPYPLVVDRVVEPVTGAGDLRFLAGTAALVAALVLMVGARRRWPRVSLGLCCILAGFVPVSNAIPLFNPMAERYMYFMVVGFAMAVAWPLARAGFRAGSAHLLLRQVVLAVMCTAYLSISVMRMQDWKDDATLWRRTLAAEPLSARAHTWVGLELKRQGRFEEAMEEFAMATRLNPHDIAPLVDRGILYGQVGDLAEAERSLREAVDRRPDKVGAHWNLAVALQLQGREVEALAEIDEALRIEPMHMQALRAKVILHVAAERYGEAMAAVEQMLEVDPGDREASEALDFLREQKARMTKHPMTKE